MQITKQQKYFIFWAKQYKEMSGLPKYKSQSKEYNDNAEEYLKIAVKLENELELYPENRKWALAAKELIETSSQIVRISNSELNIVLHLQSWSRVQNVQRNDWTLVQSVFNRINSDHFPNNGESVAFASDQFQPFFPPVRVSNVNTENSAARHMSNKEV